MTARARPAPAVSSGSFLTLPWRINGSTRRQGPGRLVRQLLAESCLVAAAGGALGLFRKTLVTVQTAVSVLLLVAAGLFGRTLVNLTAVELGLRPERLVSFGVMPKLNGYTDESAARFYTRLTERLAAMPGATLTGSFAGLAALLAAMGLYGVLAYNVARRTSEIGIRMALGASAGTVLGLVVRDGALIMLVGTAAGLAAAAAMATLLQPFLYELTPWDPVVYGSAAVALGLVAPIAAWVPTRRATNIDPMIALRCE